MYEDQASNAKRSTPSFQRTWNLFPSLVYTALLLTVSLGHPSNCPAQNPIVQSIYTADPAALVHDGTVYLYTGHDEDDAPDNRYLMHDYRCYSTTDMVNWTDHGAVLDIRKVFHWSGGDANAAHCIYRDSKFYYYVSTGNTKGPGGVALGVAVSDSPLGPFQDALGRALVTNDQTKYARHGWDDLDPAVFIDDDGRTFLYWGNNACYFAELNDDMISLKGDISFVPLNEDTFGPDFEEAPWLYKRNGLYYLVYASGFPESIRYATSTGPAGPWAYQGLIMDRPRQRGLGTNHPAVIDYKGNSYLFYHTAALPGGGDKRRCVCVEPFLYNEDGSIPKINCSNAGVVKGVAKLDPFARTEAETIAWASGVETAKRENVGVYVTDIDNGDYIKVRDVDFGDNGATRFLAHVAALAEGGAIELRHSSEDGPAIGVLEVKPTGSMETWQTQSTSVADITGVQDLYLKFTRGRGPSMSFDWWKFE